MSIDLKQVAKTSTYKSKENSRGFASDLIALLNKDMSFTSSKLDDKKKERFYSDLNILLTSGIDIKTAFELIVTDQKKKKDIEIFTQIKDQIISGSSMSQALLDTNKFTMYEYYSIKIGEESGRLPKVLDELTIFFSKKIKQKRQLVNAFSYPILVLTTALLAVFFMMNYIVPMFGDVFKRFNSELPEITKLIIKVSDSISAYGAYFVLIIIALIVILVSQKKKLWYRKMSAKISVRVPLLGAIINKVYIARFCQSMALLISSKTPLIQAISLIRNMIGFYPYEVALDKINDDIMHGMSLHESMKQFKIFDNRLISLVKVAEEVNQLDIIFDKLNKQYSDELEHKISVMSSMLEPFLIIFVGLLVGVILVAMYLPLFQLSTSIQ